MSGRPPNDRVMQGGPHDANGAFKRTGRPPSPIHAVPRPGPYYQTAGPSHGAMYMFREHQFPHHQGQQPSRVSGTEYMQVTRRRPSLLPEQYYHTPGIDRDRAVSDVYTARLAQESLMAGMSGAVGPGQGGGGPGGHMSGVDLGPSPLKRPRPGEKPDLTQPLHVDVEIKREPAYTPQVEAISPTLPQEDPAIKMLQKKLTDRLNKVEMEIKQAETQIANFKKKQAQLLENKNKPQEEKVADELTYEPKHQSIPQIIYAENRKKAAAAHKVFEKLGPKIELPLYHQPSDTAVYHENIRTHKEFRGRLILHLKRRHQARRIRERYLTDRYDQLMQSWLKRTEKIENNSKRKAKEAKMREYYEKVVPEIKKLREEKESKQGTRSGQGGYVRSDAEMEQIMNGLTDQEEEEKKMRSLSVIPPMMLDARQRKMRFVNNNGLLEDPLEIHTDAQTIKTRWTDAEKQIFKEKYLQTPKNFVLISSFLPQKSVTDCVQFYYLSKKDENYKQLLRKQNMKRKRTMTKAQQQEQLRQQQQEQLRQQEEAAAAAMVALPGNEIMPIKMEVKSETETESSAMAKPEGPTGDGVKKEIKEEEKVKTGDPDMTQSEATLTEGGVHSCAVCKTELANFGLSRPLTSGDCEQYGVSQMDLQPDMRVCNPCRCHTLRKRLTHCPIPTCRTPKKRTKRLRPVPAAWNEMMPEQKSKMMEEFQVGGRKISNLRYADDTALFAKNHEEASKFIEELNKARVSKSLKLNAKKTKYLYIGNNHQPISFEEENIEKVNTFKYLGSLKTDSGDNTNDINARIGMAKKRMQDLVNIWKDKTITLQLKIKIMKTLVWTVMTYGAEGWTIKKKQEKKINSAEMWFYRRLLRISWRERRTDQSILEELNEERKLLNYIKKRKLTFFGHTCRSKCTLMKNILQGRMEGKRQRGRPRINYFDNIKSWTQMTTREIYDVILERDVWRQMVHEAVRAANVLGSDAG
ncbi:nuclear receptor corepressor 1 [Plakobranchus ocellatus]|uniref:Nuclear receptor corepressor 1 n=1 Tax=Plakobranchus ocellatus TaxID=259542 RepID=A0AAV4BM62_9GAST|nr:nuclear receptor corepressor 1 [Plakobranchus ocellatus]